MSQNQSYFWQTTRHNVYLKRSAKLHMLLALMAVLTFSTICIAELHPEISADDTVNDNTQFSQGNPLSADAEQTNIANDAAHTEPTKDGTIKSQNGFVDAFTASISVILFTELGDKTFFIAAIMAMRHPRLIVFSGAIFALALMTVLSVVFGMAATIIPKVYTYYISTALFAIFGLKMIYEGYFMKPGDAQEELEEVQSDLRKREDELLRSSRGKSADIEMKRKNSNSDKDDESTDGNAGIASASTKSGKVNITTNPGMQHRQRKHYNNNNNNNNHREQSDDDHSLNDCRESDVFLKHNGNNEQMKMGTYLSNPVLSASLSSNQTTQSHCDVEDDDDFVNIETKPTTATTTKATASHPKSTTNSMNAVLIHSQSAGASLNGQTKKQDAALLGQKMGSATSVNGIKSDSCLSIDSTAAAGQPNGELKQIGGSKKRLEREVSSATVQDPESGVVRKNTKKGAAYLTTRVLMQAFTMTFLAEWGDRSQLTTIILAASKNVYGVIAGGVIGHSICTGLAVVGGRMVAAKISVRTVTIVGGIVFVGFAIYALIMRPDDI